MRSQAPAQTFGGLGSPPVLSACGDEAGLVVATGGEGGVVQLWDVRSAGPTQAYYDLHTEDLVRVRFQPGAPTRLLSAADDGLVCITDVSVADVDDALVDCLSVGSGIDSFGFFGHTPEDSGVWVCCSDQRFDLWSLAPPPAEENMMSEGPPRLMHFPDARPAVTELLRPFGGIGGGAAAHPPRAAADTGATAAAADVGEAAAADLEGEGVDEDGEFAVCGGGGGGMEGLEQGEPDDEDETQYLVGCAFYSGGGGGSGGEILLVGGHHDGRLSALSLSPSGARFNYHLGAGGHTATVRDVALLTNGDLVTCAEDTSLCLWGHDRAAMEHEDEEETSQLRGQAQAGGKPQHRARFTPY